MPHQTPHHDELSAHPMLPGRNIGPAQTGRQDSAADQAERSLDRIEIAFHELSNIIDGSMRRLGLATRALTRMDPSCDSNAEALRHIAAAHTAMSSIVDLMRSSEPASRCRYRSILESTAESRSLGSILRHAVEVLRPTAFEHGVELRLTVDMMLEECRGFPVFPIVVNGIRNAMDAILTAGRGGTVEIEACLHAAGGERCIVVTIADDGPGPPIGAGQNVFNPGYTTKPGSTGIGLALSREIALELGGEITLDARWPERAERRGAVLTIRLPFRRSAPATNRSTQRC